MEKQQQNLAQQDETQVSKILTKLEAGRDIGVETSHPFPALCFFGWVQKIRSSGHVAGFLEAEWGVKKATSVLALFCIFVWQKCWQPSWRFHSIEVWIPNSRTFKINSYPKPVTWPFWPVRTYRRRCGPAGRGRTCPRRSSSSSPEDGYTPTRQPPYAWNHGSRALCEEQMGMKN